MKWFCILLAISLYGCASKRNPHMVQIIKGQDIDKIEFTSYESLDEGLKSKNMDETDYKIEKAMLPKGGSLYLLEKTFNKSDPVIYALVSDDKNAYKCEDAEVSNTTIKPQGYKPQDLILIGLGAKYDKTKTEIRCDIKVRLEFPFNVHLMTAKNDTVVVYRIEKP